jgi:hypothetical protein|nr:hypothetical protein [uncultured Flavobacterium sp.]
MKTNKFAEMPDEKVLSLEKTLTAIIIIFSVFMVILLGAVIYVNVTKGFSGLTVLPLGVAPILLLNVNNLKELRKEMKNRNLSR